MQAAWYPAQQFVAGAVNEELHRDCPRSISVVLIEGALTDAEWVEERTHVDAALRVQEVEPAGRCVGVLAILCHGIIGCEKACAGDDAMKGDEEDQPFGKLAALGHLVASASVLILGSAQKRRTSATKFPATRKSVER